MVPAVCRVLHEFLTFLIARNRPRFHRTPVDPSNGWRGCVYLQKDKVRKKAVVGIELTSGFFLLSIETFVVRSAGQ